MVDHLKTQLPIEKAACGAIHYHYFYLSEFLTELTRTMKSSTPFGSRGVGKRMNHDHETSEYGGFNRVNYDFRTDDDFEADEADIEETLSGGRLYGGETKKYIRRKKNKVYLDEELFHWEDVACAYHNRGTWYRRQ